MPAIDYILGLAAKNQAGQIYRVTTRHQLTAVPAGELTVNEQQIRALTSVGLYHHPYISVVAVQDGKIVAQKDIPLNTFYPLTPLEYAPAVTEYAKGEPVVPVHVYGNLSDRCNFNCVICFSAEERTSGIPQEVPTDAYLELLTLMSSKGRPASQSLSGGGEPNLHSQITRILNFAGNRGIRTFLTTNGGNFRPDFLHALSRNAHIITVSIMGITEEAHAAYMRPRQKTTLEEILRGIERVTTQRAQLGREEELLVGVNSLTLPGNSGHYKAFARRLAEIGVDFFHINPILPSLSFWGIDFTGALREQTTAEMRALEEEFAGTSLFVRPAAQIEPDTTSFFADVNPSTRRNTEVCLPSILQPAVLPIPGIQGRAKVAACRFSPNVTTNPRYAYSEQFGPEGFQTFWTGANQARIQEETRRCQECCTHRQVLALDWMLSLLQKSTQTEFMLLFHTETNGLTLASISEDIS